jgi:hypothetical protein
MMTQQEITDPSQFGGGAFGVPTAEEEALISLGFRGVQPETGRPETQIHRDPKSIPLLAMPDSSKGFGWWTGHHPIGVPLQFLRDRQIGGPQGRQIGPPQDRQAGAFQAYRALIPDGPTLDAGMIQEDLPRGRRLGVPSLKDKVHSRKADWLFKK